MSQRLVALKDVLGALEQTGPLSSDALARRLRLSRLDARLVLVDAHAHGLVRTDSRGNWAITDLGCQALTMDLAEDGHADPHEDGWRSTPYLSRLQAFWAGSRWREVLHPRYLARHGLPLALGTIVCAGGVAVASSRLESSAGGPVVATSKVEVAAHGRHTHARAARHVTRSSAIALRHHRRSTLVSTTGLTPHVTGRLVRQTPHRLVSQCRQRPGGATVAARLTSSCTSGRRGRLHPTAAGSRTGSSQRVPQNTGSGGSDGKFSVSPTTVP
jgi:hypothetical protein